MSRKDKTAAAGKLDKAENGNKRRKFYIFFDIALFVVVFFDALHAAVLASFEREPNALQCFIDAFSRIVESPLDIYFTDYTIRYIIYVVFAFGLLSAALFFDYQKNSHDMRGIENGSAEWNTNYDKYNKRYSEPIGSTKNDGENNIILTKNVFASINTRATRLNNNVLIIGGSGTGKSRGYVKPNLLQANCNYIVTDPAGEILASTAGFLKQQGYEIKVFNLVEMEKSFKYNPFHYIKDGEQTDVLIMIDCLIKNTTPEGSQSSEPFWEKAEIALLQALAFYLIEETPKSEQNFSHIMRLLDEAIVSETNESFKSPLDERFEKLHKKSDDSLAYRQYQIFKKGAGKTAKSILISCQVRLATFNIPRVAELTNEDNIHLEELSGLDSEGNETGKKQAIFVVIPTANTTYNFLVSMMYSQMFDTLYYIGDTERASYGCSLPTPVRFLLDEFANIGKIPEFQNKLSTMRKYNLNCSVVLQGLSQIKAMYEKDWEIIIANCDFLLFLGSKEYTTLEYLSNSLGDQTITVKDRTSSQGKAGKNSRSFKQAGRKLLFPDELGQIDNDKCVLMIRGLSPFLDYKYDYPSHPNYQYTGDADKKYLYVNKINSKLYTEENLENAIGKGTIGQPMSFEDFVKKINLTNKDDLFSRFVVCTFGQPSTPKKVPPAMA